MPGGEPETIKDELLFVVSRLPLPASFGTSPKFFLLPLTPRLHLLLVTILLLRFNGDV